VLKRGDGVHSLRRNARFALHKSTASARLLAELKLQRQQHQLSCFLSGALGGSSGALLLEAGPKTPLVDGERGRPNCHWVSGRTVVGVIRV
jgi:hypothetical protein